MGRPQGRQLKQNELKFEDVKKALIKAKGNMTEAARIVNVTRNAFYYHVKKSEELTRIVDDLIESRIDECEDKLQDNIRDGKEQSIFFMLKTKGRKRGYVDRNELELDTKGAIFKVERLIIEPSSEQENKTETNTD